eukprot:CAMPEP_0119490838 /NCGR_PEP_ID=MMETSP1344-20130328/15890_1 /TAXON_ID=236787 /ORGANISM="Florenciella parvula, Strain CCMP2471" /LENGTH=71 /DNA_ID=CAMNT_0007526035 /DNA_START=566 /DNA_END=781 /DNA_ORIENTATION=-
MHTDLSLTGQQFARVKFLDGDKEDIDAKELVYILLSPTEERALLPQCGGGWGAPRPVEWADWRIDTSIYLL